MVNMFFDKKTELGASVNEELAQELHKPVTKKIKKEKSMPGLKIIFGEQILLNWVHYLLLIVELSIYYV